MELDFESEETLSKDYIMCGSLWEKRVISTGKADFLGISLHTSFLNRKKVAFDINFYLPRIDSKTNLLPDYYHPYSSFEVILKPDFYKYCRSLNSKKGIFVSSNVISSLYSVLDDSDDLQQKVNPIVSEISSLVGEDLEQRIKEDTNDWNQYFK